MEIKCSTKRTRAEEQKKKLQVKKKKGGKSNLEKQRDKHLSLECGAPIEWDLEML